MINNHFRLVPPSIDAFLGFDDIIDLNDDLRQLCNRIVDGCDSEIDKATKLYNWVRDSIPHSKDANREEVTCCSSEVLAVGTGICFAKSHLLASLMRCCQIPCGFCYQVFQSPVSVIPDSLSLHGLNATYLKESRCWIRMDPRGNRGDIHAKFCIEKERLAFPSLEFLDDCIYANPLDHVVQSLQNAHSRSELWPLLPSIRYKNNEPNKAVQWLPLCGATDL